MFVIRFRQGGYPMALPVEVCPYCYDKIASPTVDEVRVEDIPRSYFLTMDRFQYEQTRQAEKWGMKYNLKENRIESGLIV